MQDNRPSRAEINELIDKFKLEDHFTETNNNKTYWEVYKYCLDINYKLIRCLDEHKVILRCLLDKQEVILFSALSDYKPLRDYIENHRPIEYPPLTEEVIEKATWAFASVAVDKYRLYLEGSQERSGI